MEIREQPTQYYHPQLSHDPALPAQPADAATPTEVWYPVNGANGRSPRRRSVLRSLVESIFLTLFFMSGVLALAGGVWLFNSDYNMPGVTVMGTAVGTQTTAETAAALQQAWDTRQISLAAGDSIKTVHPRELGVIFDAQATAQKAHEQGRTAVSWQSFFSNQGQFDVQPVWGLDTTQAQAFFAAEAERLSVPPTNATIEVVDGRVHIIDAVPGQTVDGAATLSAFTAQAATVVTNGRFDLITQPVPAAVTDVSGLAAQAEQLLNTSVTLQAYDPVTDDAVSWVLSPTIWGEWLQMRVDPANPTAFDWTLDRARAQAFFAERTGALGADRWVDVEETLTAVAAAIQNGQGSVSTRIYHQDSLYTVQAGDTLASIGRQLGIPYPWIQQANPGVDSLSAGQIINIPSPDVMLPLPVVANKRIVVSISQQRTWVYENGQLKWDWLSSTGIDSSPTAPGVFQIRSHVDNAYAGNWDLYMPNFMGVYEPVPNADFMNGFHGFPTRDGANLLWTNSLGTPVTYGCILLSNENIAQLYQWAEEGVVVEIVP